MCKEFKLARGEDVSGIMAIIQEAQAHLKILGIDQWQNNYPNAQTINGDIESNNSYILLKDNIIVGTSAVIFGNDPTYNTIYKGKWINDQEYGVVHRIAVSQDYHGLGLGSQIIKHVELMCISKDINSIKVDTHKENKAMQTLLLKNGFVYCGIIYLEDGNERMAFQKVLSK